MGNVEPDTEARKAARKAYLKAYREKNRDRLAAEDRARYAAKKDIKNAQRKEYRARNKTEIAAKKAKNRAANRELLQARDKAYYEANRDSILTQRKKYRQEHAATVNANNRARQGTRVQRTPAWLTDDDMWMMREAYALAKLRTKLFGFEWHVDHIFPLRGDQVSGLHVPSNLQVIPGTVNCKKSNRMPDF